MTSSSSPSAVTSCHALTHAAAYDHQVAWAPAGHRLVFERDFGDRSAIFTIKPDGTDLRRLTTGPHFDVGPTFSPDAQLIAFGSDRGDDPRRPVGDGQQRRRTSTSSRPWRSPRPSPTGSPSPDLAASALALGRGDGRPKTVRTPGDQRTESGSRVVMPGSPAAATRSSSRCSQRWRGEGARARARWGEQRPAGPPGVQPPPGREERRQRVVLHRPPDPGRTTTRRADPATTGPATGRRVLDVVIDPPYPHARPAVRHPEGQPRAEAPPRAWTSRATGRRHHDGRPRRPSRGGRWSPRNVPSQGTAGPRPMPAPTIRNGISPTHELPSNTSGLVPAGSSGATAGGVDAPVQEGDVLPPLVHDLPPGERRSDDAHRAEAACRCAVTPSSSSPPRTRPRVPKHPGPVGHASGCLTEAAGTTCSSSPSESRHRWWCRNP